MPSLPTNETCRSDKGAHDQPNCLVAGTPSPHEGIFLDHVSSTGLFPSFPKPWRNRICPLWTPDVTLIVFSPSRPRPFCRSMFLIDNFSHLAFTASPSTVESCLMPSLAPVAFLGGVTSSDACFLRVLRPRQELIEVGPPFNPQLLCCFLHEEP